jgi:glycine oxidase
MRHDVIIIGAGVQGCSVGLRLAQAGKDVLLLERSIPGAEASSAAGGILSPGVEAVEPGPFFDLGRASLARYEPLVRELEQTTGIHVGYRRNGTLEVALDDEHARILAARAERSAASGIPAEILDDLETRRLEPGISARTRGALYFPDEASLEPPLLARALESATRAAGARFQPGLVQRIVHEGGRVVGVEHESGRIDADAVVLAAGAWSLLVPGHGLPEGAVRPVRGQVAVLETRPPLLSRVVFSDKGYVVPRADGRVLCGATMEEAGFQKAVTAGGLRQVLDLAIEIAPGLAGAPIVATWSNFRPLSPDGWPVLGAAPFPGLFYATGHGRNGILLAPITGDAVSAAVLGDPLPVDLTPFSAARLAPRRASNS